MKPISGIRAHLHPRPEKILLMVIPTKEPLQPGGKGGFLRMGGFTRDF